MWSDRKGGAGVRTRRPIASGYKNAARKMKAPTTSQKLIGEELRYCVKAVGLRIASTRE